jgi:hypothetical protein
MAKKEIVEVLKRLDAGSLAELMRRAGIDEPAITAAGGNAREAIVNHYRKPTGSYDMAAAARDLSGLPAIDRRLRALCEARRPPRQAGD